MSEETLQKPRKEEKLKGKGERERYTELNIEFQRIARREKKIFLNEQYKGSFSDHVTLDPGSVPSVLLDKRLSVLQVPSVNEMY